MTPAPLPPVGASLADLRQLEGLLSEARDLMSGLPEAIDDVRELHNMESTAFAIAIATSTFRSLVEACKLVDGFFDQAPSKAGEALLASLPPEMQFKEVSAAARETNAPGRPHDTRKLEWRTAADKILYGHAVRKIKGGRVASARPTGEPIYGICAGPGPVYDPDTDLAVQRAGIFESAWLAKPAKRGQVLTVDDRGALVPADPHPGQVVYCIALALADTTSAGFGAVLVQRSTLQG